MLGRIHKTALAFPGTGIELHNNEKTIFVKYRSLYAPLFAEGSACAQTDLGAALETDRIGELNDLQNQIFAYCYSAGTFAMLNSHHLTPLFVAGNSFGIYAALYANGAYSFSDGLAILKYAYDLTTAKFTDSPMGMRAIIGLDLEEILSIITQLNLSTVIRINSNNELCHIVGGNNPELARFDDEVLAAGAIKCVALPIALPYHHPLYLKDVSLPFERFLETISWHEPLYPIVSTISFQPLTRKSQIIDFIAHHLCHPINWFKAVEFLYHSGIDTIFECGPGLSLTQNARFVPGKVQWINMRNIESRFSI